MHLISNRLMLDRISKPVTSFAGFLKRFLPLGLASGLPQLLRGENHVDYRYEDYSENAGRINVQTHSVYFEQQLLEALTTKGELTYDGVSGATPTGAYGPGGQVQYTHMHDVRRAVSTEFDWRLSNQTLTPGFAYSYESDYTSYTASLNDAIEFNEKNTTLQLGVSHNFDSVREANKIDWQNKQSTEGIIGITQLLSPNDILNVAFTYGNDSGYLKDPYRYITFSLGGFAYPEVRPSHRNKEILFSSWTHYFDKLHASLEGSYRFYNDSYGITANTVGLTWRQWVKSHLILEPTVRFYEQSSADFYHTEIANLYPGAPFGPKPTFYSSDYRLSEFYSLYYGTQATVVINDHVHIVGGYHHYFMVGLDNTPSGAYPRANIFTAGITILW